MAPECNQPEKSPAQGPGFAGTVHFCLHTKYWLGLSVTQYSQAIAHPALPDAYFSFSQPQSGVRMIAAPFKAWFSPRAAFSHCVAARRPNGPAIPPVQVTQPYEYIAVSLWHFYCPQCCAIFLFRKSTLRANWSIPSTPSSMLIQPSNPWLLSSLKIAS
jgi:hypothetical protein